MSKRVRQKYSALILLKLLVIALPASAHHSAAAFDPDIEVNITGTVTELAWTSPHARLYVDVVQEDGTVVNWNFELPSPVGLMRKGWRRNDLVPGDKVSVLGIRAKAHPHIAIADAVLDQDGEAVFSNK